MREKQPGRQIVNLRDCQEEGNRKDKEKSLALGEAVKAGGFRIGTSCAAAQQGSQGK